MSIPCGILQGTDETPTTWEEYLSSSSLSSENLEVLPKNVGTFGLSSVRRNRCGAAKKQTRKTKMVEALTADSGGGQLRPFRSGQLQTLQEPGTSGAQIKGKEKVKKRGPPYSWTCMCGEQGTITGSKQAQRSSGALLMVGRRKGSRKLGNRAMPELLGRASIWPWYAMFTRGFRSPERIF